MALFNQRDTVCERETAEVKADCCESVGDREEGEKKKGIYVCVCLYRWPRLHRFSLCVCMCVCKCLGAAADGGNVARLIPEESRPLQRRCLADLPSSVWLLLAAGVEKKSGTGSESEPAVFNLRRTFHKKPAKGGGTRRTKPTGHQSTQRRLLSFLSAQRTLRRDYR